MGIKGKKDIGALQNEADVVQASLLKDAYESKEITLASPAVNVNIKTLPGATTIFDSIDRAHTIIVRTSADITLRFNNVANDPLTISAAEGAFQSNTLEIESIFLTAPAGAVVKFYLV